MNGNTVTAMELSEVTCKSVRWIQIAAKKQNWSYKSINGRGGKRKEFIIAKLPEEIRILYDKAQIEKQAKQITIPQGCRVPEAVQQVPTGRLHDLCQAQINNALAKADLLRLYVRALKKSAWGNKSKARTDFIRAYNSGLAYPKLYQELGRVSWKTVEGWKRTMRHSGDTLKLADGRGFCHRGQSLTEDQENILLRCALQPNRPKISEAIRQARWMMENKNIRDGYSDATYRRWLMYWKSHNYHIWVFSRQGAKAWNDKCAYYIERDYSLINVGDILVADGHVLNFEIINPWPPCKPKRMMLILWKDMKSNFPLGWEIMPTENTQAIASALRRAILRLGKYPKVAYLDNGKAFKARFFKGVDFDQENFTGLFERLDIKTIFAWPYHGQSKTVERFFGSFAELERWCPTYTGTSIDKKPPRMLRGEKLHRKVYDKLTGGRCITLEQAHMAIAAWFDAYAQRPQKGHLKGRSPLDLFLEGKGDGVNPAELQYLMMSIEVRTIRRNGIRLFGQNYYDPALYGRKHKVTIRYDLQDKSAIYVFDGNGDFICEARPVEKVHPAATVLGNEEDQARLVKHIKYKEHQKKQADVTARAFLENEVIPEHRRRLAEIGIEGQVEGGGLKAEVKKIDLSGKLTEAEKKEIQRKYDELVELNKDMPAEEPKDDYIPESIDETAMIFQELPKMNEIDRYEKLIELETRNILIPKEHRAFMTYYEQTGEYKMYMERFEEHRARTMMVWQLENEEDEREGINVWRK
ncbi:MAG: transposase [Thermodesulfobacteriota bacterium]|nr:transposase [Thermodesulfobacteriota bacterium]